MTNDGSLLQHHMGIGAADTKGTDTCPAGIFFIFPFTKPGIDIKGAIFKIDSRIRLIKMKRRWDQLMPERQYSFDKSGCSRCSRLLSEILCRMPDHENMGPVGTESDKRHNQDNKPGVRRIYVREINRGNTENKEQHCNNRCTSAAEKTIGSPAREDSTRRSCKRMPARANPAS